MSLYNIQKIYLKIASGVAEEDEKTIRLYNKDGNGRVIGSRKDFYLEKIRR